MKHLTIKDSIEKSYQKILDDEYIRTFVKDKITAEFICERIDQLFETIVETEKDIIINKCLLENDALKGRIGELQTRLQRMEKEYKGFQEERENQ